MTHHSSRIPASLTVAIICATIGAVALTGCKKGGSSSGGGSTTSLTAIPDFVSTPEDTTVEFEPLLNDTGLNISVSSFDSPTLGTLTDLGGGRFRFTPNPDAFGTETLSYTISDGTISAQGTIELEVAPTPDAPRPAADSVMVDEDSIVSFDPRANDFEPDGEPTTITAVTQGTSGTVTFSGSLVTYTPTEEFCGTDTFTCEVTDVPSTGAAPQSAIATVTVDVRCVNDDPEANPDSNVVLRTGFIDVNVLENDTDIDGDTLTISQILVDPALGTATIVGGTLVRFDAGDVAGADSFTYEVSDGNGGTSSAEVMITVTDFALSIAGGPLTATYDPQVGAGAERVPVRASWDTSVATASALVAFEVEVEIDPTRFVVLDAIPSADFDSTQGGVDPDVWMIDIGATSVTVTAQLPAGEFVLLNGDVDLFDLEIDFEAATRGNPAGVSSPLSFVAGQSRIETTEGPLTPMEESILLDLQSIALDDGFYYFAGAPRVPFDPATGDAGFRLDLSIAEYGPVTSDTQGFSMGLDLGSDLVEINSVDATGPLADLPGGPGPDFFGAMIFGDAMTVGVVYSFAGGVFLSFNPGAPVVQVSGQTIPTALAGTVDPVTVVARWDSSLGAPPVENVVVVGGQSLVPTLVNGALELTPQ